MPNCYCTIRNFTFETIVYLGNVEARISRYTIENIKALVTVNSPRRWLDWRKYYFFSEE